jgi:hypothetical protein
MVTEGGEEERRRAPEAVARVGPEEREKAVTSQACNEKAMRRYGLVHCEGIAKRRDVFEKSKVLL